ncbi:MAG: calcium-translocating P-type ATPase, PMCA-type [Clostridiales bacterium]|nr:calcium-translocating P-type ATPase, PMCA-type [Clostridiales bacterium]
MKGLNKQEVEESKRKYGQNIIEEAEPETFFDKLKDALDDPMLKLLIAIAVIMIILTLITGGSILESVGIIVAVAIVSVISAKTEMSSDQEYRKLKQETKKDVCKVYRDGQIEEIIIDDIVVGDYVLLQSGDKIPADGILIEGNIGVDNSSLNGESEECKKSPKEDYSMDDAEKEVALTGDTFVDKSSLFRGAVTLSGKGVMLVQKVGMKTVMGSMAKDMQDDNVDSPLKVKLTDLADKISKFGYIGAIVIFIALMIHGVIVQGGISDYLGMGAIKIVSDVLEKVMVSVTIVVMAVPEGLPLMIAIVLMQNTSKMLQKNVLVRKPIGIETAGSLNVLFSDKTGTITKGMLEVVEFFDGDIKDSYKDSENINELVNLCIGKNTAAMFDGEGKVIGGNATDKALLSFLGKEKSEKYSQTEVLKVQEFNSSNKYSAAELNGKTVYKGAPERLLSKATKYINAEGKVVDIDKDKINAKIDALAEKAMRVLGFAYSESSLSENELPNDLIIVGFVGIRDDVREEAKRAIKEVRGAGVQVVMITGDRKETAVAIAKDCGLIESEEDIALTSDELNKMSDEEVKNILPKLRVIARALPTDKSRMVRLTQELNLVCGMTGDGVNDAPALKRADVGFAMGSGTDVAKEVGDIVILDDNFKSIENAILYGRTIYNNILKFIKFQLTINVAAVVICAVTPFLGIDQPLGIIQMLWINLVMDGLGALALGAEPALSKYMQEKPKSRTQSIISKKMMTQISLAAAWIIAVSLVFLFAPFMKDLFTVNGEYVNRLHFTGYFSLFVFSAVFNGFNVRNDSFNVLKNVKENPGFLKVMGIIAVVQVLVSTFGGELFECEAIGIKQWGIVLLLAFTIIPFDMIRKAITNKLVQE